MHEDTFWHLVQIIGVEAIAASNLNIMGLEISSREKLRVELMLTSQENLNYPDLEFETNETTIKRGHMTKKENEVFLELRKEYTKMIHEVWSFLPISLVRMEIITY